MKKTVTMKEKIRQIKQSVFTGRADELSLFRSLLPLDSQEQVNLLTFHGIGGIGKSYLLEEFACICAEESIPYGLVDCEYERSVISILLEFKRQLSDPSRPWKIHFKKFDAGIKRYQNIQNQLIKQDDIPQKVISLLSKSLYHSTRTIPLAGIFVDIIGEENFHKSLDAIYSTVGSTNGRFFLEPEEELTNCFLEDLALYTKDHRLVIMFDTYEAIDQLDEWVRENFFAGLSGFALVVIAGRNKIEGKGWTNFSDIMVQCELVGFSDHEAKSYLCKRGITDGEIANKVHFAGGHPLTLSLLAELEIQSANGVTKKTGAIDRLSVIKTLIERIVGNAAPGLRSALEIAGLLRYVNEESLAAMLDIPPAEAASTFALLADLNFCKLHKYGLTLNDVIRTALIEDIYWKAPDRFKCLNAKAAKFYEERFSSAFGEDQNRCLLEILYHTVQADEEEGIRLFQSRAEEMIRYRILNRLRTLLDDAKSYPFRREASVLWRKYYEARLAQMEAKTADAEEVYQMIANSSVAEPKLQAYALSDWGEILSRFERLGQPGGIEKCNAILEKSLSLLPPDQHLVNSFLHLSRVRAYQFQWEEEEALLASAKDFYEQRGDQYGLAAFYLLVKAGLGSRGFWSQLFEVEERLEEIYRLFPSQTALGNQILWRWTWADTLAGRYHSSEKKFRQSVELSKALEDPFSLLSVYRDLGWTLACQKRFTEAEECFTNSLRIVDSLGNDYIQDYGTGYGFWGAVLLKKGEVGRAADYLQRGFEMKERLKDYRGIMEQSLWLGRLYEVLFDFPKAKECYQRSRELKWSGRFHFYTEALIGLARTELAQGNKAVVPPLLEEAEGYAQKYEYNDHLAAIYLIKAQQEDLANLKPALIYALRFNRFFLDEILGDGSLSPHRQIIPFCLQGMGRGAGKESKAEGRRFLQSLLEWWQNAANTLDSPRPETISRIPEGLSLVEAEALARRLEPGDGVAQITVAERIKAALADAAFPQAA